MFNWFFKYPLETYREGGIFLAHPLRIDLGLLGFVIICALTWWIYRRETRVGKTRRMFLAGLRVVGVSLVILALLGPTLKVRKRDPSRGVIAIAIDVSKSMGLRTADGKESRFERARKALYSSLLPKLVDENGLNLRIFAFGSATDPVSADDLASMTPGDDTTQLAGAMKDIIQGTPGVPLESMVLLTDGVDTTAADPVAMARYAASRGATVHAVGFGEVSAVPDLEILDVRAPRKVDRGALVEVSLLVRRQNTNAPAELRMYQDSVLLKSAVVPVSATGEPVLVRLSFMPQRVGTAHLQLEIPPVPGEVALANNQRAIEVEVKEGRVEVLFVEGSPRHEYGFIRRSMRDDPMFKVVTLLRLGKGQFYQRADDDSLLTEGFPDTDQQLGRYKAVILSDVEASFFTAAQLQLISNFVKTRGGGLLMLGGVDSFNLGGYQNTPIADLLPVSLQPGATSTDFVEGEYTFKLTAAGSDHEILRLTSDPSDNLAQWALMPTLKGFNPLYEAKPGATVLATGPAGANGIPSVLLAVQEVGNGRAVAFAPANTWRWRMLRKSDDDTFHRFWQHMIRWVSVGSREYVTASTDTEVASVRQPVTLTAQVLDKAHRPANNAKVAAVVKDRFGNTEKLDLPWVLREDGIYEAVYKPADRGDYDVSVSAELPGGEPMEAHTAFAVSDLSREMTHLAMDVATLGRIAESGNGTLDLTGNPGKAIASIIEESKKRRKLMDFVEEHALWDAPALLLLIAAAWSFEWLLRKKGGLA